MGKQELCKMRGVVYDADLEIFIKQPDVEEMNKFVTKEYKNHENLCIEYDTPYECRKRRNCMAFWLKNRGYDDRFYISIRSNKLYVLKQKGTILYEQS